VRPGHWRMDLRRVARMQLLALGVSAVAMSDECTYCESAKYWSYRRDGTDAGRMAAMIWRR
jgi:copper oxidase (laccase) domain-containing protein